MRLTMNKIIHLVGFINTLSDFESLIKEVSFT